MHFDENDAGTAAEKVQFEIWRSRTFVERFDSMRQYSLTLAELSRANIRHQHPDADSYELMVLFVAAHYGEELAIKLRENRAVIS